MVDATHAVERASLERTLPKIDTKKSYSKSAGEFCVFTEVKRS